jgi:hypothetical protein
VCPSFDNLTFSLYSLHELVNRQIRQAPPSIGAIYNAQLKEKTKSFTAEIAEGRGERTE